MINYRPMTIEDYEEAYHLWNSLEGIGLSEADSKENIQIYLNRNPSFSFVALKNKHVIGTALCGHDGRRGYIHHVAVSNQHKGKKIGKTLVEHCLQKLKEHNIQKCHIFVYQENFYALQFWNKIGWFKREDILLMSKDIE